MIFRNFIRKVQKVKSTIICIGRQYGSGGREIGEKLASGSALSAMTN